MSPKGRPRPASMRIVAHGQELTGAAPAEYERAARRATSGDELHRGVVRIASTLSRYALSRCVPPSAQAVFKSGLETAEAWARDQVPLETVKRARNDAFNAVVEVEQKTRDAIEASARVIPRKKHTLIDEHAELIVVRYAGLAANHACGAVLLTLDGVESPKELTPVPQQVAGALSYQSAGLGPARSQDFRATACEQAEWEIERRSAPVEHGRGGIAIQLFHEYLGCYWKEQVDFQRLFVADFITWGLRPGLD